MYDRKKIGKQRVNFLITIVLFAAATLFSVSACAHQHTLIAVPLQDATCTETGVAAHYCCKDCGKLFADASATRETSVEELTVQPYGHSYSVHYRTNETGHARVCLLCGHAETEEHTLAKLSALAATDASDGHTAGTGCTVCGYMVDGEVLPRGSLFVQQEHEGYEYCIYEPDEATLAEKGQVPLVLFLHGAGERGTDNAAQLKNAIKKVMYAGSDSLFMDAVVIAPQCPWDAQWVNTPWEEGNYMLAEISESENMKRAVSLVEYYAGLRYIDADRIYVVGLSMGGVGAWDALARHADLFAAGVPICGGGPTDAVDTLQEVPIYTFHGTADGTVPYAGTSEMVDLIRASGGENIRFISFAGEGHGIWDKAICYGGDGENESLEDWLFSQSLRQFSDA